MGWEVRPSFSVSQNAERAEPPHLIQEMWGCGSIRPDRSDSTLKYEVRKVRELVKVVLPHFQRFPLLSSKRQDFELFAYVCRAIENGQHKNQQGFAEIVKVAMRMNSSGRRKYSEDEILSSLRPGEGIVCARGTTAG